MTTLTIKVKDDKTLKLIHELDALDLIQVVSDDAVKPSKLSTMLKGSISAEQAKIMQTEVDQMRNDWDTHPYSLL
jgi:hypothetical protein